MLYARLRPEHSYLALPYVNVPTDIQTHIPTYIYVLLLYIMHVAEERQPIQHLLSDLWLLAHVRTALREGKCVCPFGFFSIDLKKQTNMKTQV